MLETWQAGQGSLRFVVVARPGVDVAGFLSGHTGRPVELRDTTNLYGEIPCLGEGGNHEGKFLDRTRSVQFPSASSFGRPDGILKINLKGLFTAACNNE